MAETIPLTRVFITTSALIDGQIEVAWAQIDGDCCRINDGYTGRAIPCEGQNWHRTRWAAENCARQLQSARLEVLRAEIARVESYRFGRPGS